MTSYRHSHTFSQFKNMVFQIESQSTFQTDVVHMNYDRFTFSVHIFLSRRRQYTRTVNLLSSTQSASGTKESDRPVYMSLIDQLFAFIGSNPEQAVSDLSPNLCACSIV